MVAFISSPVDTLLQPATRARAPSRTCSAIASQPLNSSARFDLRETTEASNPRWGSCSRDPIGYAGNSRNLHMFLNSRSLSNLDPSGEIIVSIPCVAEAFTSCHKTCSGWGDTFNTVKCFLRSNPRFCHKFSCCFCNHSPPPNDPLGFCKAISAAYPPGCGAPPRPPEFLSRQTYDELRNAMDDANGRCNPVKRDRFNLRDREILANWYGVIMVDYLRRCRSKNGGNWAPHIALNERRMKWLLGQTDQCPGSAAGIGGEPYGPQEY
jgi:hypothetical protein